MKNLYLILCVFGLAQPLLGQISPFFDMGLMGRPDPFVSGAIGCDSETMSEFEAYERITNDEGDYFISHNGSYIYHRQRNCSVIDGSSENCGEWSKTTVNIGWDNFGGGFETKLSIENDSIIFSLRAFSANQETYCTHNNPCTLAEDGKVSCGVLSRSHIGYKSYWGGHYKTCTAKRWEPGNIKGILFSGELKKNCLTMQAVKKEYKLSGKVFTEHQFYLIDKLPQ